MTVIELLKSKGFKNIDTSEVPSKGRTGSITVVSGNWENKLFADFRFSESTRYYKLRDSSGKAIVSPNLKFKYPLNISEFKEYFEYCKNLVSKTINEANENPLGTKEKSVEQIDDVKLKEIQKYCRECIINSGINKEVTERYLKGAKVFIQAGKNYYRYKIHTSLSSRGNLDTKKLVQLVKRKYPEIEVEVLDNVDKFHNWQFGINFRIPYHLINPVSLGEAEELEEGLGDTIKNIGPKIKNTANKAKKFYQDEISANSVKKGGKYEKSGYVNSDKFFEGEDWDVRIGDDDTSKQYGDRVIYNESKEIKNILEALEKSVLKEDITAEIDGKDKQLDTSLISISQNLDKIEKEILIMKKKYDLNINKSVWIKRMDKEIKTLRNIVEVCISNIF